MQSKVVELKEISAVDIKLPRMVGFYMRVATAEQLDTRDVITKRIPLSTAVWWNGQKFYQTANSTDRQRYEEKMEGLIEKIKADRKSAPEIIAEVVFSQTLQTQRKRIYGCAVPTRMDAEWCAIITVLKSLIDIKKARA